MIVVVSGWRLWQDAAFIERRLQSYVDRYGRGLHVRVGCAAGVDRFTRDWLRSRPYPISYTLFHAGWDAQGRAAGPFRNGRMLRGNEATDSHQGELADRLLAFPEPRVRPKIPGSGTWNCIIQAFELGISLDIPGFKQLGSAEERV